MTDFEIQNGQSEGNGESPPPPPTTPTRSDVLQVGQYRIHWSEYGDGDPPLVLLHGLSGSANWWGRNIPQLARRHRLYVPDLIGFGRSTVRLSVPRIEGAAEAVAEWADAVGVTDACLIGHSMGGQIAAHVAASRPAWLKRLVLVDPAGLPRPLSPGKLLRFAAELTPMWSWGDPRFLPTIIKDAWKAGPIVLARSVWNIIRDDVEPLLPEIAVPTLIIWGERDRLVPLSDGWKFRDGIADSSLVVLRGAGHNAMVDRPRDFNRIVSRFLDGERLGR